MPFIKQAAQIVEAFVSRNEIPPQEIPALLQETYQTLLNLAGNSQALPAGVLGLIPQDAAPKQDGPIIPVEDAIKEDSVACLICGNRFKTMKGHLAKSHGLSINEYRQKFQLTPDFPMVAPSYSERRRQLAVSTGLGAKKGTRKKATAKKTAAKK